MDRVLLLQSLRPLHHLFVLDSLELEVDPRYNNLVLLSDHLENLTLTLTVPARDHFNLNNEGVENKLALVTIGADKATS